MLHIYGLKNVQRIAYCRMNCTTTLQLFIYALLLLFSRVRTEKKSLNRVHVHLHVCQLHTNTVCQHNSCRQIVIDRYSQ